MLDNGSRVLMGISGGVDSLVLAWILKFWQKKAPIDYEIFGVHLDNGFGTDEYKSVEQQLQLLDIPFLTEHTSYGIDAYNENPDNACFSCARQRRNHLFEMARQENYTAIALGHHKDDIIETFFLNMLYSGNISTMLPKQDLFNGTVSIIRPLSFLTKSQVFEVAKLANISPVKNPCPMAEKSKREKVRGLLENLYTNNPQFKNNIFSSLSNVRTEYLLKKH